MNAVEYAKKFRRVAVISMLVVGVGAALTVFLRIVPLHDAVPFVAFAVGLIPIIGFAVTNRPVCDRCGGGMKLRSGFPNLVYECRQCKGVVDTGLPSDY
jgi:hypothetical protein